MKCSDGVCVSPITNPDNFWKTIKLYLDKPHAVNKRLAGSVPLSHFKVTSEVSINDFIELRKHLRSEREYNGDSVIKFLKRKNIDALKCPSGFLDDLINIPKREDGVLSHGVRVIILSKLLPKNKTLYTTASELVLIGK